MPILKIQPDAISNTESFVFGNVTATSITANGTNLGLAVAQAFTLANTANKSTTSNTAPTNPNVGDTWFDTVTGVIFRYTYDGVSNNWIDVSGPTNSGYIYQSYAITPNTSTINETTGNTVIYTVTTTNTADNTVLYWTNSGTTVAADFSDSANNGTVTITNNSGTITRSLSPDSTTEGSETIILNLRTGSSSGPVVAVATTVTVGDTSQTPVGYTIDYLTVGGGGGGADTYGGGGGAGGFLDGSQTFYSGYTYTITIGAGSAGILYSPSTNYTSSKGSNTSIVGSQSPAISIVAFGGGSGTGNGLGGNAGNPAGGSGGGGGYPGRAGELAIGSPGVGVAGTQGYPGAPIQGSFNGGGGGGAAQAGQGSGGGAGKSWPFDFSAPLNNRYAGGGGGGGASPPSAWGGPGGLGGGGTGKNGQGLGPGQNAGAVNTGGGGGGGATVFPNPGGPAADFTGAGGSGVVLLAVPNAQYPGVSAPGATVTTPPAAPGKTVLTYTSSGTFTA
jgi:hypothetical protein